MDKETMRLATIRLQNRKSAALRTPNGYLPIAKLNQAAATDWPEDLFSLINSGRLPLMTAWSQSEGVKHIARLESEAIPFAEARPYPLYRHPSKIWGIGLNYVDHASDLDEKAPTLAPASFMKPDTAIIGPGEQICIPKQSQRTTAEAELGLIFGKRCKDVPREQWLSVIAGFTTIIDMTAEDILRQNPRYLTMSKSFDSFFSFGPELVTPDEVQDVFNLKVQTICNGKVHAENVVSNMTFPPDVLVAFHSAVMTMQPGDIISTGTPGAVPIAHDDRIECSISGFETLKNTVRDLKVS